jgi:hypothetical protein
MNLCECIFFLLEKFYIRFSALFIFQIIKSRFVSFTVLFIFEWRGECASEKRKDPPKKGRRMSTPAGNKNGTHEGTNFSERGRM